MAESVSLVLYEPFAADPEVMAVAGFLAGLEVRRAWAIAAEEASHEDRAGGPSQ